MNTNRLLKILDAHGIAYEIVDNKIMVEDHYTVNGKAYFDILDMTDISECQLWDWLGY